MSKVYQVTACRFVRIEVVANDSDDAWEEANLASDSDWEEYDFEIQDVECVSSNPKEHFGPDRHGE